uniref:IMP2-like protein n=1 Tax=Heterorhabditis bacteriophora TaxID=37862 RepID=A0A1I7WZK5_HETBA
MVAARGFSILSGINSGNIHRGDIVGCLNPTEPNQLLCKRIVAKERDKVDCELLPTRRVPQGHVFIQGDNLMFSSDSRHFGPVPEGLILHLQVILFITFPQVMNTKGEKRYRRRKRKTETEDSEKDDLELVQSLTSKPNVGETSLDDSNQEVAAIANKKSDLYAAKMEEAEKADEADSESVSFEFTNIKLNLRKAIGISLKAVLSRHSIVGRKEPIEDSSSTSCIQMPYGLPCCRELLRCVSNRLSLIKEKVVCRLMFSWQSFQRSTTYEQKEMALESIVQLCSKIASSLDLPILSGYEIGRKIIASSSDISESSPERELTEPLSRPILPCANRHAPPANMPSMEQVIDQKKRKIIFHDGTELSVDYIQRKYLSSLMLNSFSFFLYYLFEFIFEKGYWNKYLFQKSLNGFRKCAAIAAHYGMKDVFDNLVIHLCKFSTLTNHLEGSSEDNLEIHRHRNMNDFLPSNHEGIALAFGENKKAQMATKTLFQLVHSNGDILRELLVDLSFLLRDAVHVTPDNFESCIQCLRTMIEASLDGGRYYSINISASINSKHFFLKKELSTDVAKEEQEVRKEEMQLSAFYQQVSLQLVDLCSILHSLAPGILAQWAANDIKVFLGYTLVMKVCSLFNLFHEISKKNYFQRAFLPTNMSNLGPAEWESCFGEAVPESLKNMLLVVDNTGLFSSIPGLYQMTVTRMGNVLPQLIRDTIPNPPAPVLSNQTSLDPTSLSSLSLINRLGRIQIAPAIPFQHESSSQPTQLPTVSSQSIFNHVNVSCASPVMPELIEVVVHSGATSPITTQSLTAIPSTQIQSVATSTLDSPLPVSQEGNQVSKACTSQDRTQIVSLQILSVQSSCESPRLELNTNQVQLFAENPLNEPISTIPATTSPSTTDNTLR